MDSSPLGSSIHGNSPGKTMGVGCHDLLQEIFPTHRSNPVSCTAGRFFTIWATREAQWERTGLKSSAVFFRIKKDRSLNWNHEIFVLWVGLISFSTFSKFTCVVTCIRISLLFMVEYYHIVCIYYILFVHWSVESSQFYFIIFLYLLFGCKGLSYST